MTPDQEVGHFVVEQSQKILELTKRAEAADLALQNVTKERDKYEEFNRVHVKLWKEDKERLQSELAQARQQAIADPGIREIAALSLERALLWHKAGLDSWSESDWFTAFAGEVGELGNVIKKLNRYRDGLPGNSRSEAELRLDAAKEIADCYLYMDLLAQRMSIDLLPAIIAKFNEVSERNNFPQRIRSLTPPPALTKEK